jgi:hypothetical protein
MPMRPDGFDEAGDSAPSRVIARLSLFAVAVLGTVFVAFAIFYVWIYVQQVQNGYRLAKYYEEHEQLVTVQRKLRLEWSRFQDPFLLEEMGRKQFGLVPPKPEQKILMP